MHLSAPAATRSPAKEFAVAMAALGPFEARPVLAVAVSGGPDSMALALLVADWAAKRDGRVEALIVDHRLRPESAREARQVGRWLKARGIAHRVLVWQGPRPARRIQARARAARYDLLTSECRRRGRLHLLLGHQRDDQAETVLMRQASGSGSDGLAGMASLVERDGVRLLRPLLDIPRARLVTFLNGVGQGFVDDPSNRDGRYLRPRLRQTMAPEQCDKAVAQAREQGVRRNHMDAAVARLLVRSVRLHPAGYAELDRGALVDAPDDLVVGALGSVMVAIGGTIYRPASAALERLVGWLRAGCTGGGRTLGGCRLIPDRDQLYVFREPSAIEGPLSLVPGRSAHWDGRFALQSAGTAAPGLTIRAPRGGDLQALRRKDPAVKEMLQRAKAPARQGLPVLQALDGFLTVPHLDFEGFGTRQGGTMADWRVAFRPIRPLSHAPFQPSSQTGRVARTGFPGV
ncbi:MAG: tRNA lysidine(34) synthetase TilS [Alphaproteobacteria bacterium]|nr:tRNA lysidine(34) synthetase TilS [Alphaproteobacteria bacterium]